MRAVVLNKHNGAVGITGGITLAPGESVELDLSDEDYFALKEFEHVELSDLDRPASSGHKKPAKKGSYPGL